MFSNAPRFALSNSLVLVSTLSQFLSFICLVDIKVAAVTTIPVAFVVCMGVNYPWVKFPVRKG